MKSTPSLHARLRAEARANAANPAVTVVCRKAYAPFTLGATYTGRPCKASDGRDAYSIQVNGVPHVVGARCFEPAAAV